MKILQINEQAEQISGCIRFDKGSAKFDFPVEFLSLLDEVKPEIQNRYLHYPHTGGESELRNEVVKLELDNNREITTDDITITHGGMSGLFSVFGVLFKPNDEIITNEYCFEGFSKMIESFNLRQKRVRLGLIDSLEKNIGPQTKAIILNSPENPTGKLYSQLEIDAISKLAKNKGLWLISDEVMNLITYDKMHWNGPTADEHVIIINSFSKNFFIPGIRVGWVVTKNRKLSCLISDSLTIQSIGVNLFGQILCAKILLNNFYQPTLTKNLSIISERKNFMASLLDHHQISYKSPVDGGMNFYVDLRTDTEEFVNDCLKRKVAFIPGKLFEGKISTWARIGFGAVEKPEIESGINLISDFLPKE